MTETQTTHQPEPETIRYTADVVCVREDGHVLLIERGWDPYRGLFALPGGHIDAGETARQAAVRELQEEAGVGIAPADLTLLGVYDAPGRDPRGRYVTGAYLAHVPQHTQARAGDDAAAVRWIPLHDLPTDLAFDHAEILADARRRLPSARPALADGHCRLIVGPTGSGKSRRLQQLIDPLTDDPTSTVWAITPTDELAGTDRRTHPASAEQLLTDALAEADRRLERLRPHRPTADQPRIRIVIDAAEHVLRQPKAAGLIYRLLLTGRHAAVETVLTASTTSLEIWPNTLRLHFEETGAIEYLPHRHPTTQD